MLTRVFEICGNLPGPDRAKSINRFQTLYRIELIKCGLAIIIFGVVGMVVGTYVSVDQLVIDLSPSSNQTSCIPANLTDQALWFSSARL